MPENIIVGRGESMKLIPRDEWEQDLRTAPDAINRRLEFMSEDHHRVRNHVVRELPRLGRPIAIDEISRDLHLSTRRTAAIVEELEKNLFFLVRAGGVEVSWAFPVTAEQTEHHLVFSTGERLNAA